MRVLVFSEVIWPEGGGGELATYLWLRVMSRRIKVTLVTSRLDPSVEWKLRSLGVGVVKLGFLDTRSRARFWRSLERNRREVREVLSMDYDVAIITRLAFPLIPLIKEAGRSVAVHLHDYVSVDPSGVAISESYWSPLASLLGVRGYAKRLLSYPLWWRHTRHLDSVDGVIFVSRRQRDIICSRRPSLCRLHEVIPNPLPLNTLQQGVLEDRVREITERLRGFKGYVLFSGGLSKLKGYHIARRLARILAEEGGLATIITKADREKLEPGNGILYLPRVGHDEHIALLAGSKALIHPSITEETLGYAIIESLLAGVPPITTRVGGVPEVLGQEYPGFIADTSAKGLRSLARSFLENHDLLQDYVRRRAKYLESEWGDDKLADMIIAFIKRLLEIK